MANLTKHVKKLNRGAAYVADTDYYQWLGQAGGVNYTDEPLQSTINYLETLGFEQRKDTVDQCILDTLKNIHHCYFIWEIKS